MIYFNGNYLDDASLQIDAQNRAFKYGDALFESCLYTEGKVPLIAYNEWRLKTGMQLLQMEIPEYWTLSYFTDIACELAKVHGLTTARIKYTVWRNGAGLYAPKQHDVSLLVEIFPLDYTPFSTAPGHCSLGIYKEYPRLIHPLSSCKTANALHYVLAGIYAQKEGYDDVLLLNTNEEIADAIASNIFLLSGHTLITTENLNGGVRGTMQQWLCENAEDLGYQITRKALVPDDLPDAEALFLTNAIQGIRPVTRFREGSFDNKKPLALLQDVRAILFD